MSKAQPSTPANGFKIEPLHWLLLAVPAAVVLKLVHAGDVWIFLISCVAIIPLAGLMGRATENLAETLGAGIGGLLNATFGNAAELIIALAALWAAAHDPKGPEKMHALVKASVTGSIIGNILLVLGLSILAGGLRFKKQTFNRTAASMGATMLALAAIGLLMPTLYFLASKAGVALKQWEQETGVALSEEIAVVLAVTYGLSLLFSLKTHQHLFAGPEDQLPTIGEHHQPEWSRRTSLIVLVAATVGVAVMSELLVKSVEHAGETLGMNEVFMGVIVVAVIGNAAEHSTAILVALKDKMDLAVTIAVGSSIQIALFVAPVLVFASLLMGPPLDLHFSLLEIIAVVLSVGVLALVSMDGECHWMEGVMLLAVYLIFALAFFHLPEVAHAGGQPAHP
jgi:Ca2+:H+ antiporter